MRASTVRSMMKRLLAILAVLTLPVLANAIADGDGGWTDCNGVKGTALSPQPSSIHVAQGRTYCYEWENVGATDGDADSEPIFIEKVALIWCNMDTDDINPPASSPGVVTPRMCPSQDPDGFMGNTLPTLNANNCTSLGALAGTEGAAAAQTVALRIQGPSWIYFDLTTAVPDMDDAKCTITGEFP